MLMNILLMAPQQGGQGGIISYILPFVIIIGIMYFLIIRPQQKEQKKHQEMVDNLQKSDKIVTNGGIKGIIVNVKKNKNTLVVKTQDSKIEIYRSYVAKVENKGDET